MTFSYIRAAHRAEQIRCLSAGELTLHILKVRYRVPTLLQTKIQEFSRTLQDTHEEFSRTIFGAHEYLNIKKTRNPRPKGSRVGARGGVLGQGAASPLPTS